ncbi:unnamed protein product [Dracunculus medinensis]|uniref:Transmembrane protein n=1 Tax=Dracunculus medinensis TaxID=318479 RepID=A0A0N4U0Q2_DRAME|nr:unnamed protein product [Dracunculus medinensis]
MAPRYENSPTSSWIALSCFFTDSWPMLAFASAACLFIGLVFFLVGLVTLLKGTDPAVVRSWIFFCTGIFLLVMGLLMILLCRIRNPRFRSASRHRRHATTRPQNRRDPLPVWTIDAIDPTFRPPPPYSEVIQCSSNVPHRSTSDSMILSRPPPYSAASIRNSRITDV